MYLSLSIHIYIYIYMHGGPSHGVELEGGRHAGLHEGRDHGEEPGPELYPAGEPRVRQLRADPRAQRRGHPEL